MKFTVRNWKYSLDTNADATAPTGYAHPAFVFTCEFPSQVSSIFVDGEGMVPVRKKPIWDFGDGTRMTSVVGTHAYSKPGVYTIRVFFIDRYNNLLENNFSYDVTVLDIVSDRILATSDNTYLSATEFFPFSVEVFVSRNNIPAISGLKVPILLHTDAFVGAFRLTESYVTENPYWFLVRSVRFYELDEQNVPTLVFSPTLNASNLYFKFDPITLEPVLTSTLAESYDSTPVGLHGTKQFYIVSDFEESATKNIWASLDTTRFVDYGRDAGDVFTVVDYPMHGYLNMFSKGVEVLPGEAAPADTVSFTSNGRKFGSGDATFDIYKNRFIGIPFTVTLALYAGVLNSVAYKKLVNGTDFTLSIDVNGLTSQPIDDYATVKNIDSTPGENTGGYWKGTITLKDTVAPGTEVTIRATVTNPITVDTEFTVMAYSNTGIGYAVKNNESFDMANIISSYRTQENLANFDYLFNTFMGDAVGNADSDELSPGKAIYEKIVNFQNNRSDIDRCDLVSLGDISMAYDETGLAIYSLLPAALKRTMDIWSIKRSYLFGATSKFARDFNDKGYIGMGIYGKNKGKEIAPDYIIKGGSGEKVVAYEIFSESYILLTTDDIKDDDGTQTDNNGFTVSDAVFRLRHKLGWNLVLPDNLQPQDLANYYIFYHYIEGFGNVRTSVVDFATPRGTLTDEMNTSADIPEVIEVAIAQNVSYGLHSGD